VALPLPACGFHKGGGNEPAQAATVVNRSPAELNFIFLIAGAYWNVMSTHFEMSVPRPELMVMQPRTRCLVLSLTQIE